MLLIIDPESAATVRHIFELAAEGNNPNRIAGILHDEKRLTPCNYYLQKGINAARTHLTTGKAGPYEWNRSSVEGMPSPLRTHSMSQRWITNSVCDLFFRDQINQNTDTDHDPSDAR